MRVVRAASPALPIFHLSSLLASLCLCVSVVRTEDRTMNEPKRVAAIVTEYRRWSHADVIVGKIIEGFNYDNKDRPRMRLVSLYVDQVPKNDMSAALAKKYNFLIFKTIEGAVTLGRKGLNVDGVLCIGEHGNYPRNARGQILY